MNAKSKPCESGRVCCLARVFAISIVMGISAAAHGETTIPSDPKNICPVTASTFAGWFRSGAVSVNGEVRPADSLAFPDAPNCSFYEWAEHMFLWLTSPTPNTGGGDAGRVFDSDAFFGISAPDAHGDRKFIAQSSTSSPPLSLRAAQFGPHGLPVIFDKSGRMLEVLSGPTAPGGNSMVSNKAGAAVEVKRLAAHPGKKPEFVDAAGKRIPIDSKSLFSPQQFSLQGAGDSRRMKHALESIHDFDASAFVRRVQAGGNVVFLDKNGDAVDLQPGQAKDGVLMAQNGSLVYYASMVNDVFAYLKTGEKNGALMPVPTHFPVSQAELDPIVKFAAAHGHTFAEPEALAIEVKTAWIETTGLDPSRFITIKAKVPAYDTSSPTHWTLNGARDATLALVGMHVVGSTKGHPEMIWATFEHLLNAPNAAYSYTNAANGTTSVGQSTAGHWLLAADGAPGPFNAARMTYNSPDIVALASKTIGPSDIIRWKAWGAASDAPPNPLVSVAGSNAEIISINNSVRGQLLAGDVRSNYFFTGATWTIGGQPPAVGNQVGTSKMANTTMETFQQGLNNTAAGRTNCFVCHTSNTFSVSHFYDDLLPLFP